MPQSDEDEAVGIGSDSSDEAAETTRIGEDAERIRIRREGFVKRLVDPKLPSKEEPEGIE